MKSILLSAILLMLTNFGFSQSSFDEDLVRRTILTVVKDFSKRQRVEEVFYDVGKSATTLNDGSIAVTALIQWNTANYFRDAEWWWVRGYLSQDIYTGKVYWITESCSNNMYHNGKYEVGYLYGEDILINSMGIGRPMRKTMLSSN